MTDAIFSQIDFGPLKEFLVDENVTDISYSNSGQVWLKTLDKGVYKVERPEINNPLMEKLAFQCSNVMGKTFNMAHPFLDAESTELRMNFVHDSIATNGVAVLIRKTPAKIRLNREKLIDEEYLTADLNDFLNKCVVGHCNIIVSGETGSGKTELVKYLASQTIENEKIIMIEDTLELHLDRIFPHRDIIAMKTNNIASYTEVLVTCMRQNPRWILLSEVRSAEAVMAVRNSISSGHNIISTIHADKAQSIPMRMYSLLETQQDINQFLNSIHRYVQIGIHVRGYMSKTLNRFQREIQEVVEFFVNDENKPDMHIIYKKNNDGTFQLENPSKYLRGYLDIQGITLPEEVFSSTSGQMSARNIAGTESFNATANLANALNAEVTNEVANPATISQSQMATPDAIVEQVIEIPPVVLGGNIEAQPVNMQVPPVENRPVFQEIDAL